MTILHIAALNGDKCSGVNKVVPIYVRTQQKLEDVALVNIYNLPIDGVEHQLDYTSDFELSRLSAPFNEPDLVVFHELYHTEFLKISNKLINERIPYVIIPHGGLTKQAQRKKQLKKTIANLLLFNRYFKKAELIQCLSEEEVKNTTIKQKKIITPNGIEPPKITKSVYSEDGFKMVYIGRLEIIMKGIDLMIEAVAKRADFLRESKVTLDLYGADFEGQNSTIIHMIKKHGVGDIIRLNGAIFDKGKEDVLLSSDCFIQTSRYEGMPMGLIEAMAYGLPVVATEGTYMADIVRDNNCGWSCKNDCDDIAQAIVNAINAKTKLCDIGKNSAHTVRRFYDSKKIAQDTIEVYKKIIIKAR